MDASAPGEDRTGGTAILLVDDQPEGLLTLEAILQDLDVERAKARSGREALRQVLARDFAVVLLDVNMPEMDGYETAALIRERPRSRSTPIIFLTATHRADVQLVRGCSLGAVDYLLKPLEPEILRAKVAVFVELARKTELLRVRTAELARREKMIVAAHRGRFRVLLVWSLDCLHRSMVGSLQTVFDLDRRGVQVISVGEPWLDMGGPGARKIRRPSPPTSPYLPRLRAGRATERGQVGETTTTRPRRGCGMGGTGGATRKIERPSRPTSPYLPRPPGRWRGYRHKKGKSRCQAGVSGANAILALRRCLLSGRLSPTGPAAPPVAQAQV
jgi:CheY-like chemotaxis protein